jgi:hypothetical protein
MESTEKSFIDFILEKKFLERKHKIDKTNT